MRGELQLFHNGSVRREKVMFVSHLPGTGSGVRVHHLSPEQNSSAVFLGEVPAAFEPSSGTDKGMQTHIVISMLALNGSFLYVRHMKVLSIMI